MMRRLALTCATMVFPTLSGFVLFSVSVAMLSLLGHTQTLPYVGGALGGGLAHRERRPRWLSTTVTSTTRPAAITTASPSSVHFQQPFLRPGQPPPPTQPTHRPRYDSELMQNMNAVAHWQTLMALIILLIRDADMFQTDQQYESVGAVMLATNLFMLSYLLLPVLPQLRAEIVGLAASARASAIGRGAGVAAESVRRLSRRPSQAPGPTVFANPMYRPRGGGDGGGAGPAVEVEMVPRPADEEDARPEVINADAFEVPNPMMAGATGGVAGLEEVPEAGRNLGPDV